MRKEIMLLFCVLFVLLTMSLVSGATDCWSTTNRASETACEANADCQWHEDSWGSWCEQKSCWNLWGSTDCQNSSSLINMSCNWRTMQQTGWCMEVDCWAFEGTNESACESNSYGLNCNWVDTYSAASYDYPCMGASSNGVGCWEQTTQSACTAIAGCSWGSCEKEGCWDQTTATTCAATTGYNNQACKWNAQYSYCTEASCWDYTTSSTCQAASGCKWSGGACSQQWCSDFGYKNETYCENNTAGLNCNFNSPWCEEKGCWSYTSSGTCGTANSSTGKACYWELSDSNGGWCEEVGCWNWGSYDGGNESACLGNGTLYNLSCVWGNDTNTDDTKDGWCYEDVSSKSCVDLTTSVDCRDTYYCVWNATSSGCQDPVVGEFETVFDKWYPGCEIFSSQSACGNITGCSWSSNSCLGNATITNSDPSIGGVRCNYINNSNMCNKITMLPNCCTWQSGTCADDKFSTRCWDEMEEFPEGATYCEDFESFTDESLCNQIAGDPWYMPCRWANQSTSSTSDDRCQFKFDQIFEAGRENLMYLDSEQTCESAGGKWVVDMYASGNDPDTAMALPFGHCEENFGGRMNCDADCYACDFNSDGSSWSSASTAEEGCYSSALGTCAFTADTTAPNGYGRCRVNDAVQQGIAANCDEDCGSCTYKGNSQSAEASNKPSYFCENSVAEGGCKWVPDLNNPTDESKGRCAEKAEKTCEDKCDICLTEDNCVNQGKKKGDTSLATQCTWSNGICTLTSGGDQMEICWDGTDNNNNGKVDCADSMCYSDSSCGGGFMAGFGGKDCFGYDSSSDCTTNGCVWMNENWGEWCDMPGANCWKKDGDQSSCQADGNCSWHSGFGGFCEENWTMMDTCMNKNESNCGANVSSGCTWVQDQFYQDNFGGSGASGWCDPRPNYLGSFFDDCPDYDYSGEAACTAAGTADTNAQKPCQWFNSSSGTNAGGWCDHMKFACWQFNSPTNCTSPLNQNGYNHSEYCVWSQDEWGGMCEGKTMSGTGSANSCWNQASSASCTTAGCVWQSGFCDPVGFGNEMGFGGSASGVGGDFGGSGGCGSSCFLYDGNQTGCTATQGCGWTVEQNAFCDVNKGTNCPQYSYNSTICDAQPRCIYDADRQFCGDKPFACSWNASYSNGVDDVNAAGTTDAQECESNPLCGWGKSNNFCQPLSFNGSITTEALCNKAYNVTNGSATKNQTAFTWVTGWCNSGTTSEFFDEMENGEPVPLGSDTLGDAFPPEIDILSFGMKDMGPSFGFAIGVNNLMNASMCNGVQIPGGLNGNGYNTTKFYWYLDTDGTSTGGCSTLDTNAIAGFEFYFKNLWSWSTTSGSNVETIETYRCSDGSWVRAPIQTASFKQKSCMEIGGALIAVEKGDLEKFPTLYSTGTDMRVYVATSNSSGNISNPSDTLTTANIGYVTPGAIDQDVDSLDLYAYRDSEDRGVGDTGHSGYVEYADIDCWTQSGCADYQCTNHPYCLNKAYGVEAAGFSDTRVPRAVGLVEEAYPDGAAIKFFTDKPSNGSLMLYGSDASCDSTSLSATVNDIGVNNTNVRDYRLSHVVELFDDNGARSLVDPLTADTAYYYKLQFCDENNKCGISRCSNFTTAASRDDCAFCDFVVDIKAPTGWNVSYDINQDKSYEFDQKAFDQAFDDTVRLLVNYSTGRRANIMLATTSNSSYMEFIDAKLTMTGLSSAVRDIDGASDGLASGTTTTSSGASIGYAGMDEDVRDKIVFNLYPEICYVKVPGTGTCAELWHCNDARTACVDRTAEATLNATGSDYCIWQIPYCEFSAWAGGQPGTPSGSSSSSSSSSGGGGGGGAAVVKKAEVVEETPDVTEDVLAEETGAESVGEAAAADVGDAGVILTDLTWLWLTLVGVAIIVAVGIHLYKKD